MIKLHVMDYSSYIKKAHEIAKAHGFHDVERPESHYIMLTITEVSEMVEADRKNIRTKLKTEIIDDMFCFGDYATIFESSVKDTLEDEMADACIRIFDIAGTFGWNLSNVSAEKEGSRAYNRIAGKSFTEIAYSLCNILTQNCPNNKVEDKCVSALAFIENFAKDMHIDLSWHIEHKMKYNETRARLHGKKY